jgi:uncharacterized protein (TIGR00725 family)
VAKTIIGVMGPGNSASAFDLKNAYDMGRLIAEKGYVTLTGGRACGVMEAALKGAKDAGGQTLGILPSSDKSDASEYADIVVVTAMMSARNNINVLTSDVVVACGIEAGTLSEIALALKAGKVVVLISQDEIGNAFLEKLGKGKLYLAREPRAAMELVERHLQ